MVDHVLHAKVMVEDGHASQHGVVCHHFSANVASQVESDLLCELVEFIFFLMEEIIALRDGFFAFSDRLLQEGDLVTLGGALTVRLWALQGGDGGGISFAMLRLPPEGGTIILIGSLRFLTITVPYYACMSPNNVLTCILGFGKPYMCGFKVIIIDKKS